jgi:hypothetical protein
MSIPISNVTRRVVFAPSNTGPYAFTFEILAVTDIEVYKGDTLLTLTTDYTVTINPNGTGSVTLVATAGTDNITIIGARAIQRTTDFVTGGDLFASTLNTELDSLTIFAQQNSEAVNRALQAPETDPTTINMTLPRLADRAGKYLAFDANGNPEPGDTSQDVAIVAANINSINTVKGEITPVNNIATVAGAVANIATVAGISANVTTVANISGNVTTVAGISADVTAVAGDATDIGLVAAVSTDVAALGPIAADITAVAAIDTDVTTLAAVDSDIAALGPIAADITTVAGISADVTAVAGDATDIGTVAGLSIEIAALGPIAADITTVAGIDSDVTAVAADATDIGTVATNIANVNTVAGIDADVTTVAGISADVTAVAADATDIGAVAAIAANVTTVAGIAANVTTVAGIDTEVTTVANNVADITNFSDVYLGPKSSDPATRNDSSALQAGDLYFNTVDDAMKVYTGSAWVAAYITAAGFVTVADAQTITGVKTFDNGLATDTISEETTAAGVTIDGVLLKDSAVNKVTITAPATSATLTIANSKTLTANNSLTLAGTDSTTMTFPTTSATIARTDAAQTFTGVQTFSSPIVVTEIIYPVASFSWNSATSSPAATFQSTAGRLINAHRNMRRCLLLDNGTVNYYLDPTDSTKKADGTNSVLTGADGMVMVEIPKFYVRRVVAGTITTWFVADTALPGFVVHPAFNKNGVEVNNRYYSAYDACAFDVSGSVYISGLNRDNAVSNTPNVDATATTGDKLASVSGIYPMVGLTRAQFRTLAANRGSGWRQLDWTLFSAVQVLYLTEYQTFFSQSVLGDGNVNGSYVTQSGTQNDSPNSVAGLTNSIGNASTNGSQASAGAKPGTAFMSYRGIENFYGNVWNWADGIIGNPDGSVSANQMRMWWTNNSADFSDSVKTNMTEIAVNLATGDDFAAALAATDYFFVATSVSGGSSSTYTTDRWAGSTSDDRVVLVSGAAGNGASAGAFAVFAALASSYADRAVGGRLAF